MLADEEIAARLEAGVTLALDTNVSRSSRVMVRLLDLAAAVAARGLDVRLAVPAPAFAEILMDLREHFAARYDPDRIATFLTENARLDIPAFDASDADHMAARLHARFGDDERWQQARIDAAFAELRLSGEADGLRRAKARCSASIDWLIGSQADRRGWLLVTDDRGPEFADIALRAGFAAVRAALKRLAADTTRRES